MEILESTHVDLKLKNNWGLLSSTFHVEQPETLIEWKFKSMTRMVEVICGQMVEVICGQMVEVICGQT